jgi:putative FmdB family regulatory protein
MPTYEYECRACGHAFETMHSMTAPVLRKCPKCARLKLERLISGGAGVIFKGSGFYETDYKAKRGGPSSKRDEPTKKDEPPKAETKSDANPEPKSESKSSDAKPKKDASKKD